VGLKISGGATLEHARANALVKIASGLVAALPEICGHQFSSFTNNTPAKYINSQY
jgi:hypothetical protein